jgi:hypothetical protein
MRLTSIDGVSPGVPSGFIFPDQARFEIFDFVSSKGFHPDGPVRRSGKAVGRGSVDDTPANPDIDQLFLFLFLFLVIDGLNALAVLRKGVWMQMHDRVQAAAPPPSLNLAVHDHGARE